jgi:N-acetylneuraminic acid mutarotase
MNMTKIVVSFIVLIAVTSSLCQADCKYLLDGDLNRDCQVDFYDFSIFAQNWLIDCEAFPLDPSCRCDIPWVAEPPMYTARDQFTGGVINGKIYVFGGNGNPDQVNLKSTEALDPNGDWAQLADNNHNDGWGVEELTGAVVNGKLYVFGAWGGIGPSGNYGVFNFNEQYDPNSNTWTSLAPKPTVVTDAATAVYEEEIYLFGGYYADEVNENPIFYDVVEAYDPNTNSWRSVTTMPKALLSCAAAVVNDKAYIIGGYSPEENQLTRTVMTFDFQTEQWDVNSYEPLPEDRVHASLNRGITPVIDGKIFLIGGGEGDMSEFWPSDKVDIYDTVSNTWQIGPSLPLPHDNLVAVVLNGKIYVIGGCNGTDFMNRAKSEVISMDIYFCDQ